jgi:hemerythrin-like domain-containing protein
MGKSNMKRHPALRQLSSDHHVGLVLARKARQAAKGSVHDRRYAWTTLVTRFRTELDPHFRIEESGLLSALRQVGETELVQRTLNDHEGMRALIAQDCVENLMRFAELLTAHIRFEEQILFERAQQLLDPEQLEGLAMAEPILD